MVQTLWALWIIGGGYVNGGALAQPEAAAYFWKEAECSRVQAHLKNLAPTKSMQCIQAEYVIGK